MNKALLIMAVAGLAIALCTTAAADTLYLKTGVAVHGKVTDKGNGVFELEAGGRKVMYRAKDVVSVEKNDKTGVRSWDEVEAKVESRLEKMERLTGLTLEQRTRVDRLVADLATASPAQMQQIRETFIQLHQDWGLAKYFKWTFGFSKPPWLLVAMVWIEPGEAIPILQEAAENPYFETRARAIELLGRLGHRDSAPLVARGLMDHTFDVKLAAIYALGNLNSRAATPALIEMIGQPDIKLANAAREALAAIWQTELGDLKPRTVSEWQDFVAPRGGNEGISLANLEPLILPEFEMVMG